MDEFFVFYIIGGVVTGLLGGYVSSSKNRGGAEGFVIGFLFSLIGVLIIALMPNKSKAPKRELTEEERIIRQEKLRKGQEAVVRNNKILLAVVVLFLLVAAAMLYLKQKKEAEMESANSEITLNLTDI